MHQQCFWLVFDDSGAVSRMQAQRAALEGMVDDASASEVRAQLSAKVPTTARVKQILELD